jgi:hypothetical protein
MFLSWAPGYSRVTIEEGEDAMELKNNLGSEPINKVLEAHPYIGEILQKYEIACVTCGVGICLLKDVVSIHALGDEIEKKIEREINDYLDGLDLQAAG